MFPFGAKGFFTFSYDFPPVISYRLKHFAWISIKITYEHVSWWESWLLIPCPLLNHTGFFTGSQREDLVNRNIRHKLVGLDWYITLAQFTFKAEIIVMWTGSTFLLRSSVLVCNCFLRGECSALKNRMLAFLILPMTKIEPKKILRILCNALKMKSK